MPLPGAERGYPPAIGDNPVPEDDDPYTSSRVGAGADDCEIVSIESVDGGSYVGGDAYGSRPPKCDDPDAVGVVAEPYWGTGSEPPLIWTGNPPRPDAAKDPGAKAWFIYPGAMGDEADAPPNVPLPPPIGPLAGPFSNMSP